MKNIMGMVAVFALVLALNVAVVVPAHAETSSDTNISSLMDTVKSLLAKVADLQKELAKVRGDITDANEDIHEAIKSGLKEGMTDEDIKKVQELLAADKEIYPEGMITGYYGNLTKEALKRFQTKHDLKVTGQIDEDTRELIEEYFGEKSNGKFPQGIFHASGIVKKVQDRFCERKGMSFGGWFCQDWNDDDEDEDDDNCGWARILKCSDEDEDEDDVTEEFDVVIEIEDGVTTVAFTFDDEEYSVEVESTSQGRVLTEVAEELDTTVRKLDSDLKEEITDALSDAVEEEENVSEDEAQDALDAAEDAIEAVEADIEDADEDVDTDEAQEALEEAEELLVEAQEEFDDEDFEKAVEEAEEAEEKAEEAASLLEEAIEDAE